MKKRIIIGLIAVGALLAVACLVISIRNKAAYSISVIGGADGPTAIFVAGKLGGSENIDFEEVIDYMEISQTEAKALMDELNPRTIIPMHYKEGNRGIQMISEVTDFTKLYEGSNRVIANAKGSIVVNHGTEGQQSEGYSNLVVMALPEI